MWIRHVPNINWLAMLAVDQRIRFRLLKPDSTVSQSQRKRSTWSPTNPSDGQIGPRFPRTHQGRRGLGLQWRVAGVERIGALSDVDDTWVFVCLMFLWRSNGREGPRSVHRRS